MLRLLFATIGLLYYPISAAAVEVDVELFLAVDVSRSMSPGELELQRRGYAEALRSPAVAEAVSGGLTGRIALTYVEWAGDQKVIVPWTLVSGADELDAFASKLTAQFFVGMRRTSISRVIEYAARSLDGNAYTGMRRVIDVSGDGPNNLGPLVVDARDRALAAGIVINGLPLMTREGGYSYWDIPDLDTYYRRCVVGGPASFVVPVTRWEAFPTAVRQKLVQELVGLPIVRAQLRFETESEPYDCEIGEKMWRNRRSFVSP